MSKNRTIALIVSIHTLIIAASGFAQQSQSSILNTQQYLQSRARFVESGSSEKSAGKTEKVADDINAIKLVSLQDDLQPPSAAFNAQQDVHELAFSSRKIQDIEIGIRSTEIDKPADVSNFLLNRGLGMGSWEDFGDRTVCWPAPQIAYHPLYFEDVRLERYGQVRYPCLQPARGAIHFFGSLTVLPWLAYQQRPLECEYPLGYCRPGNINPYTFDRWWIR
jgi:hypothetical protein